jgi:superfamily II DNA/RNA helicase
MHTRCTLPRLQVVLVSATMTKAVKRLADAQLPNLLRLEASGFHKPTAGARQEFRVLPPGGDKLQMLLEVLQADLAKKRKVLVFCGSMDSCRAVEHSCADRDLPTVCYHGDMPIAARKESMALFAGACAGHAARVRCHYPSCVGWCLSMTRGNGLALFQCLARSSFMIAGVG